MTPPASSLNVGVGLPGEQFAQAAAMIFKFSDDLLLLVNSPAMQQARQNADVQAAYDRIAKNADDGLKPGASLEQVEKDLS